MEGGLLLDVVVGQSAAILQLLAGEDEALLIRGDALLVLNGENKCIRCWAYSRPAKAANS